MSFIIGFLIGGVMYHAYVKGWLVAPAIFVVKTVKGWFA